MPYPLPKMDMIAIPDFAAGAMENYGLVTYRETVLLYDEQHSAASNKQRVLQTFSKYPLRRIFPCVLLRNFLKLLIYHARLQL